MLYRIRNGLAAIAASAHLQPAAVLTRGSETRYRQMHCRTNTYGHTFIPSAVCLWNALPVDVCRRTASMLNCTDTITRDVDACQPCFYPLHHTVHCFHPLCLFCCLASLLPRRTPGPIITVRYCSTSELAPS